MLLSSSLNECRSPGLTAATLVLTRSRLVAFVQDDRSQWRVLFVFPLAAITMLAIGLGRQLFSLRVNETAADVVTGDSVLTFTFVEVCSAAILIRQTDSRQLDLMFLISLFTICVIVLVMHQAMLSTEQMNKCSISPANPLMLRCFREAFSSFLSAGKRKSAFVDGSGMLVREFDRVDLLNAIQHSQIEATQMGVTFVGVVSELERPDRMCLLVIANERIFKFRASLHSAADVAADLRGIHESDDRDRWVFEFQADYAINQVECLLFDPHDHLAVSIQFWPDDESLGSNASSQQPAGSRVSVLFHSALTVQEFYDALFERWRATFEIRLMWRPLAQG
eukprot:m.867800 g.867800  ORF g.867800 m.867800 type:complete len:337 (-) comp59730_c0_seq20:71-1081(-)